jgi:hypothetical protein
VPESLMNPEFEEHLSSLQGFRDWLASLVEAQQPLEEWSLSLEELRRRWAPQQPTPTVQPEREVSRLYF